MIKFGPYTYEEIEEFDCRVLHLKNKKGGSFFTVFPISPLEYRRKRPERFNDKVEVAKNEISTIFIITDDWNCQHVVEIGNLHEEEIERAIQSAKEGHLLVDTQRK